MVSHFPDRHKRCGPRGSGLGAISRPSSVVKRNLCLTKMLVAAKYFRCCAVTSIFMPGECLQWVDSGQPGDSDGAELFTLLPLGPGHDHVNVAATTPEAEEPFAPVTDRVMSTCRRASFGGMDLGRMVAIQAPPDQPFPATDQLMAGAHPRCCSQFVVPG